MKKKLFFAFVGAIALSGAVGITSCSSSDEEIDNPDFDSEANAVKVQIAISLQDNIAKTRMSGEATQSSGQISGFKGMKNIMLVPFKTATVESTTSILEKTVIGLTDIDPVTSGSATEANKVYSNVTVPVTTNRFLLYGNAGQTEGFDDGALTFSGLTTASASNNDVSGVSISPVSIYGKVAAATINDQTRISKNILQLLNRVAESSIGEGASSVTWAPGVNVIATPDLALLYPLFIRTNAGASYYVQKLLEDIYNKVNALATDGTTSNAHNLAVKIQDNIKNALTYTDGETINCAANTVTLNTETNKYELTLSSSYLNYPTGLNLPAGSARIQFDPTTSKFVDITSSSNSLVTAEATPLANYVYPANLQYFVDTDILTADTKVLSEGMTTFSAAQALYGTSSGTSVTPNTRSILLNKQIQYGVGRLETKVNKVDGTTYYDHDGAAITIPAGGYTLTGILIGDQRAVDWQFVKKTSGSAYTIYDKKIGGSADGSAVTTSDASVINHTLVLESAVDASVNIALEFVNNGGEFKGHDGIRIPAGATFYLIGTLNPTAGGIENYGTGAGQTNKVFTQDFVTKATFTIKTGANGDGAWGGTPGGLGEAYIGLPDLTMPQMELGLSVDLSWKPGLEFNIDL